MSESTTATKAVPLPVSAMRLSPDTLEGLNGLKKAFEFPNLDALLIDMIVVYSNAKQGELDGAATSTE